MVDAIDGRSNTGGYVPEQPPAFEQTAPADPAMLIAELIGLSERSQDAARTARRIHREQRHELTERRLSAMVDAADERFAAGVIDGAAQIGSAAADYGRANAQDGSAIAQARGDEAGATRASASATRAGAMSSAIAGSGKILSSSLERSASDDDVAAGRLQDGAETQGELAEDAGDELRRSEGREDRALQHLADIEQARMQAQIAASRG